ncbi:MAG: alpha-L-fucosidase [Lentisphaeria bacterium]|nr:alpha-L-fucosidase [Lentisphaeria bacterium]
MNSWGYCADDDLFSSRKLERQIALYTSLGSNFLFNAGPKPDGTFPERTVKLLICAKDHTSVKSSSGSVSEE